MSIIDDYADIARRMRGEPKPEPTAEVCARCEGGGWVERFSHNPPAFQECPDCCNPEGHPCP